MNEVRVSKKKLLATLKKNRAAHHAVFVEAEGGYREKAITLLAAQLNLARTGHPFNLAELHPLTPPEDHTDDYDRAIQMLEMSVDNTVTLSASDFSNLVQDQWDWSHRWAMSNSRYISSPVSSRSLKR